MQKTYKVSNAKVEARKKRECELCNERLENGDKWKEILTINTDEAYDFSKVLSECRLRVSEEVTEVDDAIRLIEPGYNRPAFDKCNILSIVLKDDITYPVLVVTTTNSPEEVKIVTALVHRKLQAGDENEVVSIMTGLIRNQISTIKGTLPWL